jgi:hypothetical protein
LRLLNGEFLSNYFGIWPFGEFGFISLYRSYIILLLYLDFNFGNIFQSHNVDYKGKFGCSQATFFLEFVEFGKSLEQSFLSIRYVDYLIIPNASFSTIHLTGWGSEKHANIPARGIAPRKPPLHAFHTIPSFLFTSVSLVFGLFVQSVLMQHLRTHNEQLKQTNNQQRPATKFVNF